MKYKTYKPLIDIGNIESTNVVPENIFYAQQNAFYTVKQYINNEKKQTPIEYIKKKLNIKKSEKIEDFLTAEQIDSIILAIYNIETRTKENKKEFIIADDTGIGKGRILASIARYAMSNNKNVIFITEAEHLFTDFYRDLTNTNSTEYIKDIFILHNNACIYDKNNNIVKKSLSKINNDEIINNKSFCYIKNKKQYNLNPNIIFSTYSQFNKKDIANKKIELLKKYIEEKETIIIFDEFHNAVGNSTTNKSKDEIINLGAIPIYSSATAIDNYDQLSSFFDILAIDKNDYKVIEKIKFENNLNLKNQIAYNLTNKAMFLRREHTNVKEINYNNISNDNKNKIEENLKKYKEIIFEIFSCYQLIEKLSIIKNQDKNKFKNKWLMFGSTITRLAKVIILMGKKEYVVNTIKDSIKNNQKCVITLNSTFSSLINICIEFENKKKLENLELYDEDNESEKDEEKTQKIKENIYENINFKTLLKNLIENILGEYTLYNNKEFNEAYQVLNKKIEKFPDIELSIIDEITNDLKKEKINVLEISGRNFKIIKDENKKYKTINFKKEEKEKPIIINKFNNTITCKENQIPKENIKDRYDVIIITLAGSTGTSLHSSKDFSDQRQRKMIEMEITPRVKKRIQFFGRVYRRGQINEPEIISVSSGTEFEKRIITLEENKLKSLRAFIGSDYEVNSIGEDYYNDDMNYLAQLYLINNEHISKILGISIYNNEKKYYHIDMLMKRSILLNSYEQEKLFEYLEKGYQAFNESLKSFNNYKNKKSEFFIKDIKYIWGNLTDEEFEAYKKMSRKEKIKTELPVVFLANTYQIIELKEKENIINNQYNFEYNLNNIVIPNIYNEENKKIIYKNIQNMKKINKGTQLSFIINDNKYYGFVKNISIPENKDIRKYITHYLYEIELINQELLNNKYIPIQNNIKVMGNILMENKELNIYEKEIDINKYTRKNFNQIKKETRIIMGNIFYINYINSIYKLGKIITFEKEIDGKKEQLFGIEVSSNINIENIFKHKPIIKFEILKKLILEGNKIKEKNGDITIEKNKEKNNFEIKISKKYYENEEIINHKCYQVLGKSIKEDKNKYIFIVNTYRELFSILYQMFNNKWIDFLYEEKFT